MNKEILVLVIVVVVGASLSINFASAETYRDYDGKLITEEQYVQRVNICEGLQAHNNLDKTIDCMEYALTQPIHDHWVLAYEVSDMFDQFLQENNLKDDMDLSDIKNKLSPIPP